VLLRRPIGSTRDRRYKKDCTQEEGSTPLFHDAGGILFDEDIQASYAGSGGSARSVYSAGQPPSLMTRCMPQRGILYGCHPSQVLVRDREGQEHGEEDGRDEGARDPLGRRKPYCQVCSPDADEGQEGSGQIAQSRCPLDLQSPRNMSGRLDVFLWTSNIKCNIRQLQFVRNRSSAEQNAALLTTNDPVLL